MYCPNCKVSFGLENILSICDVCGAALVDSKPDTAEPDGGWVELFKTPDIALFMVVKSALEASGIPFAVQGEEGLHMLPLTLSGGLFNTSAYGAVIRVRLEDYADAKKILADAEQCRLENEDSDESE